MKKQNKMVTLTVRFWTNGLKENNQEGINPKHIRESGVLRLDNSELHGIKATYPTPFNSLGDLTSKIEKELIKHKIVVHTSERSKKFRK